MTNVIVERTPESKHAILTLNRPEKLNALNSELLDEMFSALSDLASDEAISAVIIQGANHQFSAGYDITAGYGSLDAYSDWRHLEGRVELWERIWQYPKPLIAAVEGHCLGGATMMVACCDLVVVSDDANIGWPSVPLGGGLLSPVSLWHVGMRKAKELSFIAGNHMTGAEAANLGWANLSVEPGTALSHATEMARRVCKTPLDLLYLKKRALNRVFDRQGFSESLRAGAEWDAIAHAAGSLNSTKAIIREKGLRGAIDHFTNTD